MLSEEKENTFHKIQWLLLVINIVGHARYFCCRKNSDDMFSEVSYSNSFILFITG